MSSHSFFWSKPINLIIALATVIFLLISLGFVFFGQELESDYSYSGMMYLIDILEVPIKISFSGVAILTLSLTLHRTSIMQKQLNASLNMHLLNTRAMHFKLFNSYIESKSKELTSIFVENRLGFTRIFKYVDGTLVLSKEFDNVVKKFKEFNKDEYEEKIAIPFFIKKEALINQEQAQKVIDTIVASEQYLVLHS